MPTRHASRRPQRSRSNPGPRGRSHRRHRRAVLRPGQASSGVVAIESTDKRVGARVDDTVDDHATERSGGRPGSDTPIDFRIDRLWRTGPEAGRWGDDDLRVGSRVVPGQLPRVRRARTRLPRCPQWERDGIMDRSVYVEAGKHGFIGMADPGAVRRRGRRRFPVQRRDQRGGRPAEPRWRRPRDHAAQRHHHARTSSSTAPRSRRSVGCPASHPASSSPRSR